MQLTGAFTALVTPFTKGRVDEEKYRELIEWQIQEGISGLVPCGTTGESATLSHEEHEAVIRIAIHQAKGRVPIIAGAGSNNTKEAVGLARFAKEAGADALLLITPYYNRPTQEGLIAHYKAIAKEVSLPSIVYNVPTRTGVNVLPATIAKLYKEVPEIIGIKEATGNMTQVSEMLEYCDDKFILLSGDDFTLLPSLAIGGSGVISVVSNIAPRAYADMCRSALAGDIATAKKLHFAMAPLCRACFVEINPAPVKTALSMMGKMEPELRLPMVPVSQSTEAMLRTALHGAGLLD